ncbi:MAG TPA: rhomboid family intramembrane serine protease [Candidatus Dormibacteraeota bacterium]|nr:rhomboid family intramembrane serine protease [Candidatus Dormibacteraeota bacterium]
MIKHRRWPYITTALIAVSVLVFLFTHAQLQRERDQYLEVQSRTISLVAEHPDAPLTPAQQAMVDDYRKTNPHDWELMQSVPAGSTNLYEVNDELGALGRRLNDFQQHSITARFSLYPPHRSALSYFTANFLHRDWIHLLFCMGFLWMVGGALEDLWGRRMYAGILLFCGLSSIWAFGATYQSGLVPLIGASGLVAGLIGAYVIRFPKTTIQRGTALWVIRSRLLHFSSPVYVVFPMWILGSMFWGKSPTDLTNAAYWAQAGAFGNGMVLGLLLWLTGVENYMTQQIETEVAWSVDPHIAEATEYLQRGELDAAMNSVNAQITEKPSSVEAHEMLVSLYFRKGNAIIKYQHALESLCDVQLQAANPEAAWENYETYLKVGGRKMPAATWIQLARFAENQGNVWSAAELQAKNDQWQLVCANVFGLEWSH